MFEQLNLADELGIDYKMNSSSLSEWVLDNFPSFKVKKIKNRLIVSTSKFEWVFELVNWNSRKAIRLETPSETHMVFDYDSLESKVRNSLLKELGALNER